MDVACVEFHGLDVEIFQLDDNRRIGGSADFGGIEFLVLVAELDFGGLLGLRGGHDGAEGSREQDGFGKHSHDRSFARLRTTLK